jgi:biotin operon repressor
MTQEQKILAELMTMGWVSTKTLIDLGIYQYNARIKGLRDKGFTILSETRKYNGHDVCGFRLVTPKKRIDWESMSVKPLEQEELF